MPDRVFLSGPMGSGKSSVAASLAQAWGVAAVDLDQRIEAAAGKAVSAVFQERGESGFRELEGRILDEVLDDPSAQVVALGGGAVLNEARRRRMLADGTLVTLRAPLEALVKRVRGGRGRPLLEGQDVEARLRALLKSRAAAYAECHAEVPTEGASVDEVAMAVERVVQRAPVVVPMGLRTYSVEVGAGARHGLAERALAAAPGARHVVLVTDEGVDDPWGVQSAAVLGEGGRKVVRVCLPQGEQHKKLETVERIWDEALDAGVDRSALLVAVGGGVVGDMAAFAASTLLRGIRFGQLPTTLLAMVDSAVGGKTGFDRRQGKNLVGTFYQPRFVLCDVEMLSTLPLPERRAGLAEVVKSAWLDGEASVAMLEGAREALLEGDLLATTDAVRMSVALKAGVVTRDEQEAGERALLNLGHTLGHAIEVATGYTALRHGEAVSLGMVAAMRVGRALGKATDAHVERMTRLLSSLELPTDVDRYLDDRTIDFVASDKKRAAGKVKFVVPGPPGQTELAPLTLDELRPMLRA